MRFNPSWHETNDHSKWIVTNDSSIACFGDLNRNTIGQQTRGGAYYCLNNSNLNWKLKFLIINWKNWGTCDSNRSPKKISKET